ncbi:chromosome partitioning protein [Micromonospora sp. WMMD980]|uniref:MinD/ParA family ATP-binding protein n=1 Tax=Micromonospora sp. WMMD980 TaxID=3016088 RepID=UPI002417F166|nr:chromosome partitioning protein [Micromonospora sp. WMMD980]MDG4803852.1 chromosome partitioning protein [Micromonospora sp. WMMD980]
MVHENDDRTPVPGRPQVPERDVEPLWPPEEIDGVLAAPPWAAPVQPAAPPWPLPRADAPAPSPQATPAPSPQASPVPPQAAARPRADPGPSQPGPAEDAGHGVDAGGPPRPAVGLDLPFTLDQPTPVPIPAPSGHQPGTTTPGPATTFSDAPGPTTSGSVPAPGHHPATSAPATFGDVPGPTTSGPTATGGGPESATPGPEGADDRPAGTPAPAAAGGGGAAPTNGRAASPWAQPPQRGTADPGSTGPTPADGPVPVDGAARADGPSPVDGRTSFGMARVDGPAPVVGPMPVDGSTSFGVARVDGPQQAAGPELSAGEPPRLGPFPPSPGVPMPQPPPYGNGPTYPPVPYPPQQPGPAGQPGWYPPGWPAQTGAPQPGGPTPQPGAIPQPGPTQHGGPTPHGGPTQHVGPTPHAGPTQHAGPAQHAGPPQAPQPQPPALPPGVYPEPGWTPQQAAPPTAEDFARRRQARPVDPVATMGVRAVVNRMGLVRLAPGRHEQEMKRDIEMVRRNFGGLRQVTVVNPKGGAGKTVAILLLAMTFGQKRGGYVLAWDNNETQGTLGMRAQQDFHARTVRDMLRDLGQFQGAHGRVGDLSQYVRSQGEGMFDVLASDESATGGEMLTAAAFAEIRDVVSRFYKLIFVDTGNNVRAQNWQAAMDATDQLVVTMSARNDSAETAARMLDHLEQSGRQRLVRQAVTVVSMPPSRKEIDLPAIQAHFAARTRAVLLAPYERLIDTGEPLRYGQLSAATRDAWLKIAASVAEGL